MKGDNDTEVARYPLNLPLDLKKEAENLAERQGISLNQFILWSVAEKVGELRQGLDDPQFPNITYRRGVSGYPVPVLRGTGIRVQSIAIAGHAWGMTTEQIAENYDQPKKQIKEALAFYNAHREEIDASIQYEVEQEASRHAQAAPSSGC